MKTLVLALMLGQVPPAPITPPVPKFAPAPPILWRLDYNAARIESRETGKPLLLYFTRPGCLPCLQMEASTFKDEAVRAEASRYVCLKVDAWKQPALAEALWARRFPTFLLATPAGGIVSREEGFADQATFAERLRRVK